MGGFPSSDATVTVRSDSKALAGKTVLNSSPQKGLGEDPVNSGLLKKKVSGGRGKESQRRKCSEHLHHTYSRTRRDRIQPSCARH